MCVCDYRRPNPDALPDWGCLTVEAKKTFALMQWRAEVVQQRSGFLATMVSSSMRMNHVIHMKLVRAAEEKSGIYDFFL